MINKNIIKDLIAEQMPEEGDFIEFDGWDCNDIYPGNEPICEGWDGVSNRCDCRNRRVGWEHYKTEDGELIVFACAY
jgi:hypothetical protein